MNTPVSTGQTDHDLPAGNGMAAGSSGAPAREASAEVVGDGGSAQRTARRGLSRLGPWIILGVLLAVVVLLGFFGRSGQDGMPLSPANPAPGGAMAVAEVLATQGIEVMQPGSLDAAVSALEGDDSILLLHDPDAWLNAEQLRRLDGLADRLVLVEPDRLVLGELAPGISQAGLIPAAEQDALPADCRVDDAVAAGSISPGGFAFRGDLFCFPAATAQGGPPSGSYASSAEQDIVVLGYGGILANDLIEQNGNAALALRTLGSSPTLVWYQPTPSDVALSDAPADPLNLLPGWVNPLMVWLLATALLAVLWRARRMGPLVTEPLPVVVRAAETVEGRARLYQDSSSINRAVANLRAAALTRIAGRLRLPASSGPAAVVDAAARNTGRIPADLDRLLVSHTPTSDAQLVRWSQELDALEKEVNAR